MTQRLPNVVHSLREWTKAGLPLAQSSRPLARSSVSLAARGARGPHCRASGPHCGYTLTELLVVMIILTILVAATLPVARRVMDDSRTREASRQLNAQITLARTRAAQTGRMVGILIEANPPIGYPNPNAPPPMTPVVRQSTKIYLAEIPPLYGGSTLGARGKVQNNASLGKDEFIPVDSTGALDTGEQAILGSLINNGEYFLIKFDYRGEWFSCNRVGSNFVMGGSVTGANVRPVGYGTNSSFPYQIMRAPRRVGNALELAGGTCIDMAYSGFGTSDTSFQIVRNNLIVLFMPAGTVNGMYVDLNYIDPQHASTVPVFPFNPMSPQGTMHFLVGKVEKVGNALGSGTSNLDDPNALWVSIGRQNGTVTTSENMPDVEHATHHSDPWGTGRGEYIEECRSAATGREQMGGQ